MALTSRLATRDDVPSLVEVMEAAIDELQKACSLTPENPHIHTQLAVAWREEARTGNTRAAEEMRDHIQYALRLDPNNVEALLLASEQAAADHDIESAVAFSEQAWTLEPDRARQLHEQNLSEWIRWKVDRGDATAADIQRIERVSPGLAASERAWARGIQRERAGTFSQVFSASTSKDRAALDPSVLAVRNGCLSGVGIALVSCCVVSFMSQNVGSDSALNTVLGFIYLGLFLLPVVFAYQAWKAHREKDPFP